MQKYKAKKEVVKKFTSKLQASKNVFSRGDFNEYQITDEELMEHCEDIEKSHLYLSKKWMNGKWIYEYPEDKYGIKVKEIKHGLIDENGKKLDFKLDINKYKLLEYYIDGSHDYLFINKTDENDRIPAWKELKINHSEYEERTNFRKEFSENIKKYRNTDFKNKGISFRFSQKSIDKLSCDKAINKSKLNGFSVAEHFEAINHIKELVENVDNFVKYEDRKNKDNVIAIYRGNIPIKLSTRNSYAYITIKELKITGRLVYSLELMLKKYPSLKNEGLGQRLNKAIQSQPDCNPLPLKIIQNSQNMSSKINKSLTYSGHKLQGRTKLYGMDISIENRKGSYRAGVDSDGHKWRTLMHYSYGYIRGTEGVDGDHVDCYIGPDKNAAKIYVIHQNNPVTHKYDEDKCMLCFGTADEAKKAYMKQYDRPGFFGSMDILTIDEFKSYVFSHLGSRIHKSFDITVTDITENNKRQKIEQVQKSLDAIAQNKPFMIKHIAADDSKRYDDIVLRITNFDKNKIEKAVHKMAFSLDTDIPAKGEAFNYKSQEELTNRIVKEFTDKTKSVYSFVISYFGLPEIRVVSKSDITYKGKVIYNPETGKPISQKEWKEFVTALEKFLNRNYNGMGEKIVLSAEALGRILERMSKNTSLKELQKKTLEDLTINHRTFDWISNTAKNMQDVFGESVSRIHAARIQVAIDSAAQKVAKVSDNMRNDIQQIIIDGVRDRQSKSQISQNLFDKCVGLNRDFQRIADTEIQNNTNCAYVKEEVYNTKDGEKVYFKRFEILDDNTCKKCKAIKGEIALYSETALPDERIEDPYASYAIWDGKTKGDMPMGVMHPYCRGSWFRYYPELD